MHFVAFFSLCFSQFVREILTVLYYARWFRADLYSCSILCGLDLVGIPPRSSRTICVFCIQQLARILPSRLIQFYAPSTCRQKRHCRNQQSHAHYGRRICRRWLDSPSCVLREKCEASLAHWLADPSVPYALH